MLRKSNLCSMYLPKYCNVWQALWWPCLFLNNVQLKMYGIGFSVLKIYGFTMVLPWFLLQKVASVASTMFSLFHLAATPSCQGPQAKPGVTKRSPKSTVGTRRCGLDIQSDCSHVFWKANTSKDNQRVSTCFRRESSSF